LHRKKRLFASIMSIFDTAAKRRCP
jgi:hypothetical protein